MEFDWRAYLDLAEELAKRNDEASQRSAISRAYYAAYCTARDVYVDRLGPLPLDGNRHVEVWKWFQRSHDSLMRAIGRDGRRMLTFRAVADYEATFATLAMDMVTTLVLARKTLDNLHRLD